MPKQPQQEEQSIEEFDDLEIADNDYGFVITADGELKHLFTPNEFFLDPPPVVRAILELLGIEDVNAIAFDGDDTVH